MEEKWTILKVLQWTTDFFRRKGLAQPRADAEVLLAHVLATERIQLYLRYDQPLRPQELAAYRDMVKRRAAREPTQYITQRQEFWSLEFEVSPDVLIPRPETELLVELCMNILGQGSARILDLCTGSGAVAIALAHERQDLHVIATDKSPAAIVLACRNAIRLGVRERVAFVAADLFSGFKLGRARFDIILSNPPYVGDDEFEGLAPEVRNHEPEMALRGGGPAGVDTPLRILAECGSYLLPGGTLLMEIAPHQKDILEAKTRQSVPTAKIEFHKDYSGLDRVLHLTPLDG